MVPHCQTLQKSFLDTFPVIGVNQWLLFFLNQTLYICKIQGRTSSLCHFLWIMNCPSETGSSDRFCQFTEQSDCIQRSVMLEAIKFKLLECSWFPTVLEAWKVLSALNFLHARTSSLQLSFSEKQPSLCHPLSLDWTLCLSPALLLFFFSDFCSYPCRQHT